MGATGSSHHVPWLSPLVYRNVPTNLWRNGVIVDNIWPASRLFHCWHSSPWHLEIEQQDLPSYVHLAESNRLPRITHRRPWGRGATTNHQLKCRYFMSPARWFLPMKPVYITVPTYGESGPCKPRELPCPRRQPWGTDSAGNVPWQVLGDVSTMQSNQRLLVGNEPKVGMSLPAPTKHTS